MAAAVKSSSAPSVPSLPPPCPKSPPEYPDLYGKRRGTAKVQMLEREIRFLQDELKTVEGLHPASRCCKEVTEFVVANSDPLIPTNSKNRRSCRFWKWLCGIPCLNFSWICCCCYSKCSLHLELPSCYDCCNHLYNNCCSCPSCPRCSAPKMHCCSCSCPRPQCCYCTRISCGSSNCCKFKVPSCPDCSSCCCCCTWKCCCSFPKCPKVRLCCCNCTKCSSCCCNPCSLFF